MARSVHVCSACTSEFTSGAAFNAHATKCPALVLPTKGESWDAYKARSDAYSAAWRAANGKSAVV